MNEGKKSSQKKKKKGNRSLLPALSPIIPDYRSELSSLVCKIWDGSKTVNPRDISLGFFRRVFPWNFLPGFSSGIVLKGASLKFFRRWKLVKLHSWHKGSIHFFQVTLDSSDMFLLECVLEFSQFFPISILNIVKGIYIFHIRVAGWTNLWKSLWFWSVTILAIRISLYFFPINCQKVPFPW